MSKTASPYYCQTGSATDARHAKHMARKVAGHIALRDSTGLRSYCSHCAAPIIRDSTRSAQWRTDAPLNVLELCESTTVQALPSDTVERWQARDAKTHDYTKRGWGHDYSILQVHDGGQKLRACGWGHGIDSGDYLLLQNGDGSTRYAVATIAYQSDPRDQWFADLAFAPRTEA